MVIAIDDCQLAIPIVLKVHANKGGDVHSPGQDGGVAVGGTVASNEAQELALVQLDGFTGGQVIGHQDRGLVIHHLRIFQPRENIDHPVGDILYVCGSGLHIGIFHGSKGSGKIFTCGRGGVFRRGPLGINDALHSIQIILVLQHHLVDFEDGGVVLAHLVQSLFIEGGQLLLGPVASSLEAFPFICRGQCGGLTGLCFILFVNAQRTDGNAIQN